MVLGINPTVDFAFKLMFGSPEHPRVTIHFLNSVLDFAQPVTDVEYLNPILGKERPEDKLVMLDVLAKDSHGRQYNIEMQTTLPTDLPKRLAYYNCLNYVRQIGPGEPYPELRPAVSICVLDRILFTEYDDHHLSFRLRCDQQPLVLTDDLEFHTLELPKFKPENRQIEQFTPLEKWVYLLKHAEHENPDELARMLGDPEYGEAVGILQMISKTPEDRQFYEARMKFLNDQEARIIAARGKGHEEGHKEGREEGREQGREEGREEGREQGREQGREEGREEGLLAGKIQLLQQLLGDDEMSLKDFSGRSQTELASMLTQLQERLRNRDA